MSTETGPGEGDSARSGDLSDLLVMLSDRHVTVTAEGLAPDLSGVLGAVGRFFGADVVAIWRTDSEGQVWRKDTWAATDLPPQVNEIDDPETLAMILRCTSVATVQAAAVGVVAVVPLSPPGEQGGLLVLTRPADQPWDTDLGALEAMGRSLTLVVRRLAAVGWLGQAFSVSPVGLAICNESEDGYILAANAAFATFLGYPDPASLRGKRVSDHTAQQQWWGRRAVSTPSDRSFIRQDGVLVWGRVTTSRYTSWGDGAFSFVQVEDVSDARLVRQQIEGDAEHDHLTGLVTRDTLLHALDQELEATGHGPCCLLLVDVDRFRSMNEAIGRSDGDRLLETMAERLRLATRADDVVCRLGGDEFAILLRSPATAEVAASTAQRLLALVDQRVELAGQSVATTASIGIGVSGPTTTAARLLREADAALRVAKAAGRNRYETFDPSLQTEADSRSRLEGELRLALTSGRLELHYQPEVDLATGQVLAVEALVRWPHPTMGLLHADRFVAMAEETGMVAELGRWALETACRCVVSWSDYPDLVIRVNVSPLQLSSATFVDEVSSVLQETGLEPSRLCLEITETAVMDDVDLSIRVLNELRALGLELALDDFGTGFSSLAYLRRLPVELLKIDRSFVEDLGEPGGKAIVSAVLALAAALDLDVTAEGIETTDQSNVLAGLGCQRGQGHLFSAARNEADLLDWLAGVMR